MEASRSSASEPRGFLTTCFAFFFILGGGGGFSLGIMSLVTKGVFLGINLSSAPYFLVLGATFFCLGVWELWPFSTTMRPLSFLRRCFVGRQNQRNEGWIDSLIGFIRNSGDSPLPAEQHPLNSGQTSSYSSASEGSDQKTRDNKQAVAEEHKRLNKASSSEARVGVENTDKNQSYCQLLKLECTTLTLVSLRGSFEFQVGK